MDWRLPKQKFNFGFTSKNSNDGTNRSVVHFMAVIASRKDEIAAR